VPAPRAGRRGWQRGCRAVRPRAGRGHGAVQPPVSLRRAHGAALPHTPARRVTSPGSSHRKHLPGTSAGNAAGHELQWSSVPGPGPRGPVGAREQRALPFGAENAVWLRIRALWATAPPAPGTECRGEVKSGCQGCSSFPFPSILPNASPPREFCCPKCKATTQGAPQHPDPQHPGLPAHRETQQIKGCPEERSHGDMSRCGCNASPPSLTSSSLSGSLGRRDWGNARVCHPHCSTGACSAQPLGATMAGGTEEEWMASGMEGGREGGTRGWWDDGVDGWWSGWMMGWMDDGVDGWWDGWMVGWMDGGVDG